MKKITILSLDQAQKTGYAIYRKGEIIKSGTWKLPDNRKYIRYFELLTKTIEKYGITEIVAEDILYHPQKQSVLLALGALRGILLERCDAYDIPKPTFIMPDEIKRFATNYKYASKENMIDAIKKKGYNPVDDNEADALWLMLYYLNQNNISIDKK